MPGAAPLGCPPLRFATRVASQRKLNLLTFRTNQRGLALQDPASRDEALNILRGLVVAVELHPTEDGFDIDFRGQITQMIALPGRSDGRNLEHFTISARRVAGACNHRQHTVYIEV